MDFGLSEEQELLQQTVTQLLENECPPTRLREIFEGETGFDESLWQRMAEMGLAGLVVPDRFGGAGLELLDLALVAEVMGRHAAPGPFLGHSLAALALSLGGSDAQREAWLPRLASGEVIGTVALAEADSGWQPEDWKAVCDLKLSGAKHSVLYADRAGLLVVGVAGGRLALVEGQAAGMRWEPTEGVDRTRRFAEVTFDGTPAELLPGEDVGRRIRDAALALLAADAFGGASRCLEMSVEYAMTREQFGVTIAHFQALKHQLANMAVDVEPSRGLYWYAAHAFDHLPEEAERACSLAKSHITDRFMQVARDTVEAHGGIGYTWECDVQIWFKRAMFDRAFAGTPEVHRERVAALAGW